MTPRARDLVRELEATTDAVWLDEPDEIILVRNGVTVGGGGSNGQYFAVLVHLRGVYDVARTSCDVSASLVGGG